MPNVSELDEDDRLYVLAGNETEYRAYVAELAQHGILLGDRIRRLCAPDNLDGAAAWRGLGGSAAWRGPHLYYISIGTWRPTPGENIAQLLEQCGAKPLDYWTT